MFRFNKKTKLSTSVSGTFGGKKIAKAQNLFKNEDNILGGKIGSFRKTGAWGMENESSGGQINTEP